MILKATMVAHTGDEHLARVARISRGYSFTERDHAHSAEDDKRLVSAIYKAGHLSVFEFADATYQIECPIFVARQLMRYRCASYIERSLRHCEPIPIVVGPRDKADDAYACGLSEYAKQLLHGEKKEEARMVLPLASPTLFLWKMNVRELFHVFDERLATSAQSETREVVRQMYDQFKDAFPLCFNAYKSKDKK